MSNIAFLVDRVAAAYARLGAKEMARRAGVPYTTLLGWAEKGFRPTAIELLEKLDMVAIGDAAPTLIPTPSQSDGAQATDIAAPKVGQPVGELIGGGE